MGRKILTGRFNTRCELVRQVLFLYYQTGCNMSQIGRNVQVSQGLVSKLIDQYSHLKDITMTCKGEDLASKEKGVHAVPPGTTEVHKL